MKKILFLFATLLLSMTVQAADQAEKRIMNANEDWNAAFNHGEIDKLVDMYAEDATLSPGNGKLLQGHDEIKGLFTSFKENGVHNHQIETVDVIASSNQITQVGYWKAQGIDADKQPIEFGGVLVTVLQKNDAGEWKLQSHIWNMSN